MRQYQTRAILRHQRDEDQHSYAVVEDQRFPHDERMVPIISARHARPVVVDDWNYRCTPYAAVTVTFMQAFKKMRFFPVPKISQTEANASCLTRDCFSHAVGSGYTSPATLLGLSGTGAFKSAMLMEKRDLLVAAADLSGEHAYAEYNIDLYEADEPTTGIDNELRQLRFDYQEQLARYNKQRLQGILVDISNGIDGMRTYQKKFPLMVIDDLDHFRKALQEALKDQPNVGRSGETLPSVRRERDDDGTELATLSREAFDDEWDGPRNEFEASQSLAQQEQARLEYPEERAPFQYALQKRTSEVSLATPPAVSSMTQSQIAASRVRAEREQTQASETRGESDRKSFAILNETEDLMRAQLKKGRFYVALSAEQKRQFNEVLQISPPQERIEWLVSKLQSVKLYSQFLDLITFCHVQKFGENNFEYVLNYIHQDFILPVIRQRETPERHNLLKSFYLRLYEGDGLLTYFIDEKMKFVLQHTGHYPEPPSSKLKNR